MDYLIISRTRSGLSAEEYAELAQRAKAFYAALPPGLTLKANWAEAGGEGRTLALVATDDATQIDAIQAPFREFVDMEVIALSEVEGFRD
jgi:hypothetical protein